MDVNIGGENVEKQQQLAIMEEDEYGMSVPNWLVDVLKWITRIEMANSSLSFSCKLFNRLCRPKLHKDVEPHNVPWLEFSCESKFCYKSNKFGNVYVTLKGERYQIIPIAAIPPPEYIHGFKYIIIRFLDTKIIEFVQNIALKEINLSFKTSMQKLQKNNKQLTLMGNLMTILLNNIYELQISNDLDGNRFLDFNRQFPNFIDYIPYLNVNTLVDLDLDILFNWLIKPLTDGKQKILCYRINFNHKKQQREMELRFLNRIKEEFLHSTKRNNFLVQLEHEFDQISLQNEQTREMLSLYHEMGRDQ